MFHLLIFYYSYTKSEFSIKSQTGKPWILKKNLWKHPNKTVNKIPVSKCRLSIKVCVAKCTVFRHVVLIFGPHPQCPTEDIWFLWLQVTNWWSSNWSSGLTTCDRNLKLAIAPYNLQAQLKACNDNLQLITKQMPIKMYNVNKISIENMWLV